MVFLELSECPFCGKKVAHLGTVGEHEMEEDESSEAYSHYDVVCDFNAGGCGASTGKQYTSMEDAAEAWNRRS